MRLHHSLLIQAMTAALCLAGAITAKADSALDYFPEKFAEVLYLNTNHFPFEQILVGKDFNALSNTAKKLTGNDSWKMLTGEGLFYKYDSFHSGVSFVLKPNELDAETIVSACSKFLAGTNVEKWKRKDLQDNVFFVSYLPAGSNNDVPKMGLTIYKDQDLIQSAHYTNGRMTKQTKNKGTFKLPENTVLYYEADVECEEKSARYLSDFEKVKVSVTSQKDSLELNAVLTLRASASPETQKGIIEKVRAILGGLGNGIPEKTDIRQNGNTITIHTEFPHKDLHDARNRQ